MKRRKDGLIEKTMTINGERLHFYGKTMAEVNGKMEKYRYEVYSGNMGLTNRTTFEEYAKHWLEVHTADKTHNTLLSYQRAVDKMNALLGDRMLGQIKRSELEKALGKHNDAPTMRNKMLSVTRMIYDMAIDDGIVSANPASNIKSLKVRHKERHKFTENETEAILKASLPPMERLLVDVLYYTGLRKGEALGLSRKALNNGMVNVKEQLTITSDGECQMTPILKTDFSYRSIPIPSFLQDEFKAFAKSSDTIYLFDEICTRKKFYTVWNHIMIAINEAANPNYKAMSLHQPKVSDFPIYLTPHEFRHNFCSMLYEKGVDIQVARKLMGHSSINTTLAIYTHLSDQKMDTEIEAVRDLFEPKMDNAKEGS